MAKKEETRQIRRRQELLAQKHTGKKTAAGTKPSSMDRRSVIAALGVGLGLGFLNPPGDTEDALDAGINTPGYLSVNDGVRMYRSMKKTLSEKLAEARKEGKPLRIFMLEAHDRPDAIVYELMVLHIARALGVSKFLLELRAPMVEEAIASRVHAITASPLETAAYERNKVEYVVTKALEQGYAPVAIDTLYPSTEALLKRRASRAADIASRMIREQVGGYELMIGHAQALSVTADVEERNAVMLSHIRSHGDAVILAGIRHGKGLVGPLRGEAARDVTFTFSDPQLAEGLSRDLSSIFLDKTGDEQIRWALNPHNAIQCASLCAAQNFDPRKLAVFVERVIEKANSTGLSRE